MIDIPELDDKTFEEMVDEAVKRLPAYNDDWSDYNPSDPGITLLELFAYLADTYMYQLDQVTDEHRKKYLELMGTRPQPPEPASIQLSLDLPADVSHARLPAGTNLTVVDRADAEKVFETPDDVVLTDASIKKVITDHRGGRSDHTQANSKAGMFYRAFGEHAEPRDAIYLGFDNDPFEEFEQLSLTVQYHDDELPSPATHGDDDPRFFPSVSVVWEYCTDYENARRQGAWERLQTIRDGTYAFYRSGQITLDRPESWTPKDWDLDEHGILGQEAGYHWIRCRVIEGGYEIPPQLDSIRTNVATATHRATIEDERLESIERSPDPSRLNEQRYRFRHRPVLTAEITVDGVPWEEVDTFDASGPTDRHYVLDHEAGEVVFGDGRNGRMPEPSARIVATRYEFGGGRDGNVSATSHWRFVTPDRELEGGLSVGELEISPVGPGTGGEDGESLEEGFRRLKRDLKVPYRAVTSDDYEYVATHTPGLRFGRATVLLEERTDLPFKEAPVEVRVIVVPYAPMSQSRPVPSQGFLDAVERHVDRYRLVTERVSVEEPNYVDLELDVEIQTSQFVPETRARRAIETTIESFVHPVHGFEGEGWPFGRTLYSDTVRELIEGIEFVDRVPEFDIHARGNARVDGDQNVLIDDSTLFALEQVETDVRPVLGKANEED